MARLRHSSSPFALRDPWLLDPTIRLPSNKDAAWPRLCTLWAGAVLRAGVLEADAMCGECIPRVVESSRLCESGAASVTKKRRAPERRELREEQRAEVRIPALEAYGVSEDAGKWAVWSRWGPETVPMQIRRAPLAYLAPISGSSENNS